MKCRGILVAVVMQFIIAALLAADEPTNKAAGDLHAKMRLRIFADIMGHIFDNRVQAEMKLDRPAIERLEDLYLRFIRGWTTLAQEIEIVSKGDLQKRQAESARLTEEFNKKYDAELREILTIEQIQRVQQAYLQKRCSEALREPEIVEWLELTIPQQRRIQLVHGERGQKIRALLEEWKKSNDTTRAAEFNERKEQIQDERNRKAFDVLTNEQRTKFDDLIGKPFASRKSPDARKAE